MSTDSKSFHFRVFAAAALCAPLLLAPLALSAQEPNPTTTPAAGDEKRGHYEGEINGVPVYHVRVVQRDLDAVNYLHRSGATRIGFVGTQLLAGAKGEARVQSERGTIKVDAEFSGLTPANGFGPEYLTYVLWAITPEGSPTNLGEVLPAGNKNDIHVTTALQSFGLIVTAEPYFAVKVPSDVVVMQNVILEDKTQGVLEKVTAHYALLPRGSYISESNGPNTVSNPITRDERSPLELYEAHNAYRIAQMTGAEKYAADIMAKTRLDLKNADDIDSNRKGDRKLEITFARQAVQSSEDARILTLRKLAAERRQADLDARHNAERAAASAQSAAAAAQSQAALSQADAERARAEAERAAADKARADADRARAEADAAAARADASKSAQSANEIREKLRLQLNTVLATSESARGLIVNMSDVLFDTGKYTLKPNTQISLAKVSGILQAYPGLKLQVEGYTDSVGGDDYNQKLSENRANAVRNFLVAQGVSPDNITATGYGKAHPVADNSTADGRAQNRRVQLVVSGDAIGIRSTSPDAQ